MFNFKQYNFRKLNISLIVMVLIVTIIGAFMIKISQGGDPKLFTKQVFGLILGIIGMGFVAIVDYHFLAKLAAPLWFLGVFLLLLVKVPGIGVELYEARRWIDLKVVQIQPSELCKICLIIVLASYFAKFAEKINKISIISGSAVLTAVPLLFILDQPDLSSSLVIIFVYLILLYSAGISYKIVLPVLIITVPTAIALIWYVLQPYQNLLRPYQQERILGLFYPDKYPDLMMQQNLSVSEISNGKLYGILMGDKSIDSLKSPSLPVSECDFIFTVIGESLGFLGTSVVIIILGIIILKCFFVARKAKDKLGYLICVGVGSVYMFQVFVNIGVATRILPNTGLPLPFLSYGLSSLVSYMIGIGLVLNVGLQGRNPGSRIL